MLYQSQLTTKGFHHLANGVKAWFSSIDKGFIQARAGNPD